MIAISWTDIALAALAYHHDVASTVRARSIVQPWTISIAAFGLSFVPIMVSRGDGLIIAYVLSMVAALIAALIPLFRCYGMPHGWKPDLGTAWTTAVRNAPLAAADTVEWASRRIDLAVLGAFLPASFVGIYYAAQQVATLPAKLKTSFEPVLGPAIVRRLAADDRPGIAKQVRQVTYWIIAAQAGIALALGIPGRAVMGLVGSAFTGGTAMLGFLLTAEVIAAAAVVSEAALIYVAPKRNMLISLVMLALEAGLAAALILLMKGEDLPPTFQATGPAIALCVALAFASIAKSWLLKRQLQAPVSGWRFSIAWAAAAGIVVGVPVRLFLPEIVAVDHRRPGDPCGLRCSAVDQGFWPRGSRAVPHAKERRRRASRSRGSRHGRRGRRLVPEVPHAREQHGDAGLIRRRDHLFVAD